MPKVKNFFVELLTVFGSRLGLKIALPVIVAVIAFSPLAFFGFRSNQIAQESRDVVNRYSDALISLGSMESALQEEKQAVDDYLFDRTAGNVDRFRQSSDNFHSYLVQTSAYSDNALETEGFANIDRLHSDAENIFLGSMVPTAGTGVDHENLRLIELQMYQRWDAINTTGDAIRGSFEGERSTALSSQESSQRDISISLWLSAIAAGIVGLMIASFSAVRVIRPVKNMAKAAVSMSHGNLSSRVPDNGRDEIGRLGQSFNAMADSLERRTHQLEDEKARIRSIHQSISDGIVVVDRAGIIVSVNPAAEAALGKTAIELENTTNTGIPELQKMLALRTRPKSEMVHCWDIKNCAKTDCPAHGSDDWSCWLQCGTFCYNEIQGTFKQKRDACERCDVFRHNAVREMSLEISGRHYSVSAVPILDDIGQEEGRTVVLHDVTELHDANEELESLNMISEEVSKSLDLDQTLNSALRNIVTLKKADAGIIHLLDETVGALRFSVAHNLSREIVTAIGTLPKGSGCPGHALVTDNAVIEGNLATAEQVPPEVVAEGYVSAVAAPLRSKNTIIGTVTLLSRTGDFFNTDDARLLTLIGNQVGVAVDNAQLFQESIEHTRRELAISRITATLASSLDITEVFDDFAREASQLIGFDRVSIIVPRDENLEILVAAGDKKKLIEAGTILPQAATAPGWVMQHRKPYFTGDMSRSDQKFVNQDILVRAGIQSQMNLPLILRERMLGTLNFTSIHPGMYDEVNAEEMRTVSHQVALALANKQLFEDVTRAKTEWEATFNSVSEGMGIAIVDNDHNVLRLNQAAAKMVGGNVETLTGQKCYEVIHKVCNQPNNCPMRNASLSTGSTRTEQEFPDGRTMELVVDPMFDESGNVLGAVHFLRDVTESIRLRQQLMQSEKMVAVGQLVAGVAHEINNPLTGVIGYSQLLLAREVDEKTRRDLQQIYNEAERATKIVRHLLSFARKHQPERSLVDINQVLRESLELKSYDLRVNNIEISTQLAEGLPQITADPHQLQQVIVNLIANAEHAMLDAGSSGNLVVTSELNGGTIRIAVSDTGPGIADELRDRIFDPFFTTKDVGKGTGLGLSVCYGVIEEHGGKIWVDPSYKRGAKFMVELPISSGKENVPGLTGQSKPNEIMMVSNLLLVDDEAAIRDVLRESLSRIGHSVDTAKDTER